LLVTVLSDRRLKQPAFLEASNPPAEPAQRKQPIQLPREPEPTPVIPVSHPAAPVAAPVSPPVAAPAAEEEVLYDDATVLTQRHEEPPARATMPLPPRPPSDDEEEDDQNWEGRSATSAAYFRVQRLLESPGFF